MTINRPAKNSTVIEIHLKTPHGGQNVWPTPDELAAFNKSPDQFAAAYFGLTVNDYREWIDTDGHALCAAKTKKRVHCKATLCKPHTAQQWKAIHRSAYCTAHKP